MESKKDFTSKMEMVTDYVCDAYHCDNVIQDHLYRYAVTVLQLSVLWSYVNENDLGYEINGWPKYIFALYKDIISDQLEAEKAISDEMRDSFVFVVGKDIENA